MLWLLDPRIASLELGATFLGVLAYPNEKDACERFGGALICQATAKMHAERERLGAPPEGLRLACRAADIGAIERIVTHGFRIINRQRLVAAAQALPEFHADVAEKSGNSRPMKVLTHASGEMQANVYAAMGESRRRDGRGAKRKGDGTDYNKGNIAKEIWGPSLPVLHMALALDSAMRRGMIFKKEGEAKIGLILFQLDVCKWLIDQSDIHKPIVAELFGIASEKQLQI